MGSLDQRLGIGYADAPQLVSSLYSPLRSSIVGTHPSTVLGANDIMRAPLPSQPAAELVSILYSPIDSPGNYVVGANMLRQADLQMRGMEGYAPRCNCGSYHH